MIVNVKLLMPFHGKTHYDHITIIRFLLMGFAFVYRRLLIALVVSEITVI